MAIEKMTKSMEELLLYEGVSVRTKEQATILILHSTDSYFQEKLDELHFSGIRVGEDLEFWFD
ncbi:hypothetical protein [Paenibacillus soyae]|uniref:Uncharacterized protein n=1 Tax=Paenibacillus soyae TaxID=2969249 RepID=A0A9X2MRT5_9BACL|nr:hypothetical protein [Paenibacillus soyae]MCR2807118.1 hypothetical protein [Paenibacillus soyae]